MAVDLDGPYTFIPYLPISPPPPQHPSQPPRLKVLQTTTWTYSGPLLSSSRLPSSLHSWSNAALSSSLDFLKHLLPLLSFLRAYLQSRGVAHYWLTLRATTPTGEYDVPRWHVDDDFFASVKQDTGIAQYVGVAKAGKRVRRWRSWGRKDEEEQRTVAGSAEQGEPERREGGWKLCTTLLGPSTLFLAQNANVNALTTLRDTKAREAARREHTCTSIRCAGCGDTGDAVRKSLAATFAGEEVVQPGFGDVAAFKTGDKEGAVHSEPSCREDRIFVNVVPGTEEDLQALMGRFGMEWPRAWSFGLLGGVETQIETEGENPTLQPDVLPVLTL